MKVVARYAKPEEAHLIASLLEGSGIEAYVRDANTVNANWMYSHAIGGVKVEVAECDLTRAREVLSLPPEERGLLACPFCHSQRVRMRELNLFTAICIGLGFVLPISSKRVDCLECKQSFPLKAARSEEAEQNDTPNEDSAAAPSS